jgi:hypothetical protein
VNLLTVGGAVVFAPNATAMHDLLVAMNRHTTERTGQPVPVWPARYPTAAEVETTIAVLERRGVPA